LALALIGLHLAAPLFSEASAWGLWPYTYLPRAWQLLLAALTILTILPNTGKAILRVAAGLLHLSRFTSHHRRAWFALLSLLFWSEQGRLSIEFGGYFEMTSRILKSIRRQISRAYRNLSNPKFFIKE
jgi:hypothetical protein